MSLAVRHLTLRSQVFASSSSSSSGTAEHFSLGMMGASLGNFQLLAQRFEFGRFKSVGDMGGSNGCLCACVCAAHAHMQGVTYDLPPVRECAEAYVSKQGLGQRVRVVDFDFFSEDPFPSGQHDVITMGMVLHDWGLEKKLRLIRKVRAEACECSEGRGHEG